MCSGRLIMSILCLRTQLSLWNATFRETRNCRMIDYVSWQIEKCSQVSFLDFFVERTCVELCIFLLDRAEPFFCEHTGGNFSACDSSRNLLHVSSFVVYLDSELIIINIINNNLHSVSITPLRSTTAHRLRHDRGACKGRNTRLGE